jgi:UDP-3-O-[3-hydroxymyristoyl] N-acetylglucosamine deacetylase
MTGATIRRAVTLRGRDLAGRPAAVVLEPAEPGSGITFNGVRASLRTATVRGHAVRVGRVGMVEHLLAVCSGLGVTDLEVAVRGRSLPLLDGSALPWMRALERAGLKRAGRIAPLRLRQSVTVSDGASVIVALPARTFEVTCLAIAPGGQPETVTWRAGRGSFKQEIAPARTFGPLAGGARAAARLGLGFAVRAVGGMLVPARARLDREACRHKILDLVGDLALPGRPLVAAIFAVCPGHRLNLELARAMQRQREA